MSDPGPVVVAVDEQSEVAVDLPRWRDLVGEALRSSGVDHGELNLIFVDEQEMARLNREHMDEDGPTDVLSFPLDAGETVVVGEALLGDIVVCPAYARRHAPDHAGQAGHDGSLDDELALLLVHGVLHILGHDHAEPDEARVMRREEQRLLDLHHRAERPA